MPATSEAGPEKGWLIMKPRITATILLIAALGAAGCARTFEADVSRFHQLPTGSAETVKIVPADPDKVGSLEFEEYASLVRGELQAQGFRSDADNPDMIAQLGWRLSEPREKIISRGYGGYGGHGFGHGRHGFGHGGHDGHGFHGFRGFHGFGHSGYGSHGGGSKLDSVTVRDVRLELTIQGLDGEQVFEGRANSTISDSDLPAVMPYMVQAMFTNFPGESGRTQTVELKLPREGEGRY